MNVGEFLAQKVGNMYRWLKEEGLPVDLPTVANVQLVAMAQRLHKKYSDAIYEEDFEPLLADKENLPPEMLMAVSFVQRRPELHEKFWRYLALFSDTVV